jgi:hypothetical protein
MRRFVELLMFGGACFFEGDGVGGAGGEGEGEGTTNEHESTRMEKKEGEGKVDDGPDVGGLKSALEKERAAVKEMKQQMRELQELAAKGEAGSKEAEELRERLAGYELKEKRSAAIDGAIGELTKDGKFTVDRSKVERLAGKLSGGDGLEADVREIVETLLMPKDEGGGGKDEGGRMKDEGKRVLKGQPAKPDGVTTDLPKEEWARLHRDDPEAYAEMIRARRSGRKFLGGK